jgi:hypothetical protein
MAGDLSPKINPGPFMTPIEYIEKIVTHADLTDADTSQAISMTGFPTNAIPLYGSIDIQTAFSGGSVSEVTVALGDSDPDGIVDEITCFTGITAGIQPTVAGVEAFKGSVEAAYAPVLTFTSTTDNLVNLTAGALAARLYFTRVVRTF